MIVPHKKNEESLTCHLLKEITFYYLLGCNQMLILKCTLHVLTHFLAKFLFVHPSSAQ